MNYRPVDKRNPNLPKWALLDFGPLQTNIGVLSYFDRFATRPSSELPPFRYDRRHRMLREVRRKYDLDTVAGSGDHLDKAVRVSRWLCDNVPPGGAVGVANDSLALLDHSFGQKEGGPHGLHCGQFAIVYSELMLSLGIRSRIVILEDFNPNHGGAHWVPIVWCPTPGKWAMVDPLYHAYYRDGSGAVLSPWEIRHNLVLQRPIHINKDWGSRTHPWGWSEHTLLVFYAKNLCYMGSPLLSTFGSLDRKRNPKVWLVPKGFDPVYRELKLARFYQMRDQHLVDFHVSEREYREAKRKRRFTDLITSSLPSFTSAPDRQ